MPKIQLISPDGTKMEFDLTIDRATIGRAEGNDIVIPDGSVSSRHGEILVKGESVELVDLGSTNGTHFNGQRVERATIPPGGKFKIGSVEGLLIGEAAAPEPSKDVSGEPAGEEPAGEEAAEAPRTAPPRPSRSGAPAAAVVISGVGATPCPVRDRKGFGAKVKEKDKLASLFIAIGVVSLLVCAGAAFLIYQMGA